MNQDYLTVMKKDEVFFFEKKKEKKIEIIEEITWKEKNFFHLLGIEFFFPIHKRYIR